MLDVGYDGKPPILQPVAGLSERERKAKNCPKRNVNHCVCCWLRSQRLLSQIHLNAAERLQDDHAIAFESDIKGMNLLGTGGHSPFTPVATPVRKIIAGKDYQRALNLLGDPGNRFVVAVVIEDLSLTAAAKRLGWNEKGALPALQISLGMLAMLYAIGGVGETYSGSAQKIRRRSRAADRTRLSGEG